MARTKYGQPPQIAATETRGCSRLQAGGWLGFPNRSGAVRSRSGCGKAT
jgi:hypothetical protein